MANKQAANILAEAADLISDRTKWVKDYSAKGFNPVEVQRGEHKKPDAPRSSCLPTGSHAEQWNALGALWRRALTDEAAVKAAHGYFMQVIGSDTSVNRWCAAHDHEEQVGALRKAAALAEA